MKRMYPPYGIAPQPVYPGQPPVGYVMQPMYMPPRVSTGTTKDGLNYISYYLVLQIVVVLVTSLVILPMLVAFVANPLTNLLNLLGILLGLVGLGLITLIVEILALIKLWESNKEFGPEHEKNVKTAIMMVIAQVLVGNSLGFFVQLTVNYRGSITQMLYSFTGIELVVGIISAVLGGLFIYYIVKWFLTPAENSRAFFAIALLVTAPVVNMAMLMFLISRYSLAGMISNIYLTSAGSVFGIIGNLLFYQIYRAVIGRIVTGQVKPTGPQANAPRPPPLDQYGQPLAVPTKGPQYPR